MSPIANNDTNNNNTAPTTTKRNSAFFVGLEKVRDERILDTAMTHAHTLAKIASTSTEPSNAFDLVYLNLPWGTVSVEDAARLPVKDLVSGKDNAGILMWVDSPCVAKATKLLEAWDFTFHSVLHVTSYVPDAEGEEGGVKVSRKQMVPHGWTVDGVVPSKTRQLWLATRGDNPFAYLKDASFIRKRLQSASTFVYSKKSDMVGNCLSSKKRNLANWVMYPEYLAYVPPELCLALESIHRPSAKVISLFAETLHKTWFTWGPNVPGYVSGPSCPDGASFPVLRHLLHFFTAMRNVTVQKYMTLLNMYTVQYIKQIGNLATDSKEFDEHGQPKAYLTPLVTGRMQDFVEDLSRKHKEGGGSDHESPFAAASLVPLNRLFELPTLSPELQIQTLLLISHVIAGIFRKNADAIQRRKRSIKRKRDADGQEEQASSKQQRTPRKFGIAAPVDVSRDLAKFMNLADGEKVARTTVVKFVNEYIGKHQLQNPEKKSEIVCDAALKALLNPSDTFGPVTYFNLCKLLGPHFTSSGARLKGLASTPLPLPNGAVVGTTAAELPPPPSQPQPSQPQAVVGTRA